MKMDDNHFFYKQFFRQPKVAWAFLPLVYSLYPLSYSAVGAKDALSEIFGLEHVDGTYDESLKRWFELGKIEMAPENKIQKKLDGAIF